MSIDEAARTAESATDQRADEGSRRREGSDAIAEALLASGVEIVFGYTGGAVPQLTRSVISHDIPMYAGRTELTAAWMSAGYNRVKRRAASAVITHHVGALHSTPAIYGSTMDGTPLLYMSLDNPPSMEARDGLQDALEVYPALKQVSKYIKKVTDAADLPVIVRQAVKEASTGKFGASTLVLAQTIMFQETGMKVEPLVLPKPPSPHQEDVEATWELLKAAERPVLYVGAGVHIADASAELREFTELTGIPVVSTSWGGRGLLPDAHELYAGPTGNFGWKAANFIAQQADIWVTVGCSFSQMSTGSWSMKKPDTVVQVDVNQYELAKIFQPTLGIQSDAKFFFARLLATAKTDPDTTSVSAAWAGWRSEVTSVKDVWIEEMNSWFDGTEVPINQYFLIRTLSEQLPDDALVIGDSGGNAFGLYRAFNYKNVTPLATGGHYMSLGVSLPVAIGAKLADPDRTVVSYHGDGGFYYDLMELSSLAEHNLKVIVVIDNNHCLLANRASMRASGIDNPWVDLPQTTDFVRLAKSFGVDGERVESPEQLAGAVQRALASEGSYVLDVHTTPGLRLRRALEQVIPIVGDRTPKVGHLETVLEGSWPS
ncbi:MAG TPA: thiamine pyrophosphate-binding protein [Amycolatopsis sp.]|uniref:thiamine pyrophosphate-binding protein n=1 Tax=Amycolatopsis sp. TaxID=37632 RepID=UPI002B46751E|nr:thiamine pyrophosphate-binding protein [Amycolatopsis sp.]HKS47492.1 thiamine pyrophosphate-binding protein [Amycolatopsis sp.]